MTWRSGFSPRCGSTSSASSMRWRRPIWCSRRTGDLMALATNDIELIEYFFAHTVAPAFVAMLVPAGGADRSRATRLPVADPLPFLAAVARLPVPAAAHRSDRLASEAREAAGELGAFAIDSVQGLGEIVAFQQEGDTRPPTRSACPTAISACACRSSRTSRFQQSLLEVLTGLGGLADRRRRRIAGATRRRWIPRRCRSSPCWRWRPSCRSRRSPRSAGNLPTRWAPRAASMA